MTSKCLSEQFGKAQGILDSFGARSGVPRERWTRTSYDGMGLGRHLKSQILDGLLRSDVEVLVMVEGSLPTRVEAQWPFGRAPEPSMFMAGGLDRLS